MPLTKVCVATVPIGLDKSFLDTREVVWNTWSKSPKGTWVSEYAKTITMSIADSWADQNTVINIYAEFDKDEYLAYKLSWASNEV